MRELRNVEVINIATVNGKLMAVLSFQDPANIGDINHGYDHISVPVNLRELQLSVRGNELVDQSIKPEPVAITSSLI